MTIVLELADAAGLLTDLSLATGYGALLLDQGALRLTGDAALGCPREASACPAAATRRPRHALTAGQRRRANGASRCARAAGPSPAWR